MRYVKGRINIDNDIYDIFIYEKDGKLYQNDKLLEITDLPIELLEVNVIAGTYILDSFSIENIYFNAIKYGEIDSNVEIEVPTEEDETIIY
jgi:hypothetical protein|nr:MAG TPA: hypothetical protein [Caudoviricetes sp.]